MTITVTESGEGYASTSENVGALTSPSGAYASTAEAVTALLVFAGEGYTSVTEDIVVASATLGLTVPGPQLNLSTGSSRGSPAAIDLAAAATAVGGSRMAEATPAAIDLAAAATAVGGSRMAEATPAA
ncbi:MAG TPA: hypothetical protein VN088_16295, partial [Nocardioides sp.]|nr:hypothetical protein [Nocardioides sp.]